MAFGRLGDEFVPPSAELRHFTNRVAELAALERWLGVDQPQPVPVLMFYGVGGAGKSWLIRKLRQSLSAGLPSAYLDLDPSVGGVDYAHNTARALAEIRRQLGAGVPCPRFDLAYTWLRVKEGAGDEPLFRGEGLLGHGWEFLLEAGAAASSEIPGAGLVRWLVGKVSSPVGKWLKTSGIGQWLETTLGAEDFLKLKRMDPQAIYPELHRRLLTDLREGLPPRQGKSVRGVVFVDTVETLRSAQDSETQLISRQQWLQDLYHPESGLLVVLAGRDRLTWGDVPQSDWAKPEHLEQHLVGGLSEPDARGFLAKCGVLEAALQTAILRAALDVETAAQGDRGYHCFSLGLCADICETVRRRGETIDPATLDLPPEETATLAARFLRSLGGNGTYAHWLHTLALTPRFDEAAARAAFGPAGAEQNFAWRTLQDYSFLKAADLPGWWTFHTRMRESLVDLWADRQQREWIAGHEGWRTYWQSRSETATDAFAGLAWFHDWWLDPGVARLAWDVLAEEELRRLRVKRHAALLGWWVPCNLMNQLSDPVRREDAAAALNSLGIQFCNSPLGNRGANLAEAIACFTAALRVVTEAHLPQAWAGIQNNIGLVYQNLPKGDRGANLAEAIARYTAALRIYTEDQFPQDWAGTQNNLGIVYQNLPTGDRGANLAEAIVCYTVALRVYTEEQLPEDWAMTQNNLGLVYQHLPTGDRGANLAKAITCYTAALRVRTEAQLPQDWAGTQNNLGLAYQNLPTGDRGANLAQAIACYTAALRIYTEVQFPQDWAMTQNNLGNAYLNLPTGDRGTNLAEAIACYTAALRVRTEAEFPQDWAMTQNNLGTAYQNLPTRDRGTNLEQALASYTAALRVRTEADFPQEWAGTQNNLGLVYQNLPMGDRGANLAEAIACYTAALRIYTENQFPQDWAMTQNNLGNAYRNLPTGDWGANLSKAIACYSATLRVYTEEQFPQYWAGTKNNLGNAYQNLPTGDRGANLTEAIAHYTASLRVKTEAQFPQDWSATQNNLGVAYHNLPTGDRSANLAKAIACYTAALRVRTEARFPQAWAMTQMNLGNLYLFLPTGDRGTNLAEAIACYTAALRVYTEELFPQNWAESTANLALVKWCIASEWTEEWQSRGWEQAMLWQEAGTLLEQAIATFRVIGHAHQQEKHEGLLAELRRERID